MASIISPPNPIPRLKYDKRLVTTYVIAKKIIPNVEKANPPMVKFNTGKSLSISLLG